MSCIFVQLYARQTMRLFGETPRLGACRVGINSLATSQHNILASSCHHSCVDRPCRERQTTLYITYAVIAPKCDLKVILTAARPNVGGNDWPYSVRLATNSSPPRAFDFYNYAVTFRCRRNLETLDILHHALVQVGSRQRRHSTAAASG
jgi:hypothetical protein